MAIYFLAYNEPSRSENVIESPYGPQRTAGVLYISSEHVPNLQSDIPRSVEALKCQACRMVELTYYRGLTLIIY